MTLVKTCNDTKLKDALNTAINLRSEGKPLQALRYMESVRTWFDDPTQLRRFHNGLGITYVDLCDYESAIKEYETALMISGDELETAAIQGNIANALLALGRTDETHAFLDHAEQTLRGCGEDAWLADRLETRARAYLTDGDYEKAKDAAKEAFDLHWYGFDSKATSQSLKTLCACFEAYTRAYKAQVNI